MAAIRTTIRNGRIELNAPAEMPDGTDVLVEITPLALEKVGLDESDWRDDPEALADWSAWLETLQPLEFTAEEQAEHERFAEAFRRFNVEAVRRQMQEGSGAP